MPCQHLPMQAVMMMMMMEPVVMQAKLLSGAQLSLTAITREAGQVVNLIQVIIMMINVNVDSHNQGSPCFMFLEELKCKKNTLYQRIIFKYAGYFLD